jgi:hypothetical protein
VTRDIGMRGLFLCTATPPPQNQFVRLSMTLPTDGERIVLCGRVAHVREGSAGEPGGFGLAFYGNDQADLVRWEQLVRALDEASESPIAAPKAQALPPPLPKRRFG